MGGFLLWGFCFGDFCFWLLALGFWFLGVGGFGKGRLLEGENELKGGLLMRKELLEGKC
jgi:hypothetical protein